MIRCVKFQELDFERYRQCLNATPRYVAYAEPSYLKLTNGNRWEFLVYGDYRAVMPIPLIYKWGIRLVMAPPFVQQLGVFGHELEVSMEQMFLDFLLKNYKVWFYPFNGNNLVSLPKRQNFKLERNTYETVRKAYSSNRRRDVRPDSEVYRNVKYTGALQLMQVEAFFMEQGIGFSSMKMKQEYWKILKNMESEGVLEIHALEHQGKWASVAILGKNEKEKVLFVFVNNKRLSFNSGAFLLDQVLKRSIEQYDFNFFGSNVASIAQFYKRFGAQKEEYPYLKNSKKQLILSFLF